MTKNKLVMIAAAAILLLVVSLWQFLQAEAVTKALGERISDIATTSAGTKIEIGRVDIKSPYEIEIQNIVLYDKQVERVARADKARLELRLLSAFFTPMKAVDEVHLEGVEAQIIERADGSWNYDDLISDSEKPSEFAGKVYLKDAVVTAATRRGEIKLTEVTGEVDLADMAESTAELDIKAKILGSSVSVKGTAGVKGQNLQFTLKNAAAEKFLYLLPDNALPEEISVETLNIPYAEGRIRNDDTGLFYNIRMDSVTGVVNAMDTDVAFEQGFFTVSEKEALVNARLTASEQQAIVTGSIALDGDEPALSLNVEADNFAIDRVLKDIPFSGAVSAKAKITGTLKQPIVKGELTAREGEIYGVAFTEAKAKGSYDSREIIADEFELMTLGGKVSGTAAFTPENKSYRAQLKPVDIDLSGIRTALANFDVDASRLYELNGKLGGDVSIVGQGSDLNKMTLLGSASLKNASYGELPIESLNGSFMLKEGDLTIDFLSANLPNNTDIGIEGTIIDGEKLDLKFYGGHVDLSLAKYLSPHLDFAGFADIKGEVHGNINDPQVEVNFSATNGRLLYQPFDSVVMHAAGSLSKVSIYDFSMERNGKVVWLVEGFAGLTGDKTVDITINTMGARMEDIAALIAPTEEITGNVDNIIHFTGTLDNPKAEGYIHFYRGSYRGVLLSGMDGDYFLENGTVRLQDFHIYSPMVDMDVNGYIYTNGNIDMTAVVHDINLKRFEHKLPYEVSGHGTFNGSITGSISRTIFSGNLMAPAVVLNGVEVTDINADMLYTDDKLIFEHCGFKINDKPVTLELTADMSTGELRGNAVIDDADIAATLALANLKTDKVTGSWQSRIELAGTIDNPYVNLSGIVPDGQIAGYNVHNVLIAAELIDNVVHIKQLEGIQGTGNFAAEGTVNLSGPINISLHADDLALGMFTGVMGITGEVTGTADIECKIFGTKDNPAADMTITAFNGGVAGSSFDKLDSKLQLFNGRITINHITVSKQVGGETYSATAKGIVPLRAITAKRNEIINSADELNLAIILEKADLQLLPGISKEVEWAMGKTNGWLNITGTLENPKLNGRITVADGTVKFTPIVTPITDMNADIIFADKSVTVREFSGKMGGGTYALSGQTLLDGTTPTDYKFSLIMNGLEVETDFFKGPISGNFILSEGERFGRKLPKLEGKLIFEHALVSIPTIPDTESALPEMIIDVDVIVGDKVHFFSSGLYDMYPVGSVHFGGTTHNPQSSGAISIKRGGTVSYLRTVFKIREGIATFNRMGTFLPEISFMADTRLVKTRIFIAASGPLEHMDFKLTSSPEMSETEIIRLLTLRNAYRDGNDNITAGDVLAMGLQMSVLSEIENLLRSSLFLDTLSVTRGNGSLLETSANEDLQDDEYNLEVGKYINDRTMLRYVQGLGSSKTHRIGIQYDFSDRWGISYDKEGSDHIIGVEARFKF